MQHYNTYYLHTCIAWSLLLLGNVHVVLFVSLRTQPPPKARAKPPARAPKPLPLCKALYDYDATDTDELTFKEGDTIEIIKEGESNFVI